MVCITDLFSLSSSLSLSLSFPCNMFNHRAYSYNSNLEFIAAIREFIALQFGSIRPTDPRPRSNHRVTPQSFDTSESPPTAMPTSTPSSLAQSFYGVLKPSKYMPNLSLEPSATLIDPWNLIFNITFIYIYFCFF